MAHLFNHDELEDQTVTPESARVLEESSAMKQVPRGAPGSLILGGLTSGRVGREVAVTK